MKTKHAFCKLEPAELIVPRFALSLVDEKSKFNKQKKKGKYCEQ